MTSHRLRHKPTTHKRTVARTLALCLALGVTFGIATDVTAPIQPAYAVDTVTSKTPPDLAAIRTKIKAKDFAGALVDLRVLADTVQHADVYNLIGFSLRKTGDAKNAYTFYRKALDFDPDHLGAHEYLGELYVETGEMAKAKAILDRLVTLCPSGCEEREDLEAAIAAAPVKTN